MVKKIQQLFKKKIQKIGIYIQYYPNAQKLYNHLQKKNRFVKEYELKRITKDVANSNDHKFYDDLIKIFIPTWNVKYEDIKFFGKGMGESSLDTYRKVKIKEEWYYEKIYFNEYSDLKNVLWFSENISEYLSLEIQTANPDIIFKGRELTILYFPFLELSPLSENNIETQLIEFSKKLLDISKQEKIQAIIEKSPSFTKNFKNHFLYQRNIEIAINMFIENKIDFRTIEESIEKSMKVVTHGDLNEGNGFQNNILIDWDSFGFYPIGLEVASLIYRNILMKNKELDLGKWLVNNYEQRVRKDEWINFRINVDYFLIIFIQELAFYYPNDNLNKLNEEIINRLV